MATQLIARGPLNLIGGQVVNLRGYFCIISPAKNGKKDEKLIFMPHLAVDGNGVFTAPKVEEDKHFFITAMTEISGETVELEIIVRGAKLVLTRSVLAVNAGGKEIDLGIRLENDSDGNEFNFSCEFASTSPGKLLPKGKYLPPSFVSRTAIVKIKAKAGEKELEIEFDLKPPLCPICKVEELDADGRCPSCGDTKYTVKGAAECPQCPNDECLTSRAILPVWPWNSCFSCDGNVLGGMGWFHIVRLIAQPIVGLLLFLATFFWLSIRMRFTGLILVIGWVIAHGLFSVVRRLQYRRLAEAKERDRLEALRSASRWDLITGRDEPAKEKFVKDASDKVNATEWRLVRERTLVRLVNFITAILVLGILATYGPGKFLPWKVVTGWFSSCTETVHKTITDSTAYKATVGDLKQSLKFDKEKAEYAYYLLEDRGLEDIEIKWLFIASKYDYGRLIYEIKKRDLRREMLFNELKDVFKLSTVASCDKDKSDDKSDDTSKEEIKKSYGQKWRESMWISLLIINLILPPLLFIHIIFLIAASIIHGCYLVTSELGDDIKMSWERIMEKQRAKDATAKGIPYTPPASSVSAEATGVGKIVIIDIIMEVLQAAMRKFGIMEHFK